VAPKKYGKIVVSKSASGVSYFPSIDILRGFAATSVVVYHVIELYGWKSFPTTGVLTWFRIGWMSVDLFFVISGFVIGLSAFSEIDRHGEEAFQRPFMRRRICRIAPLYYLTCLAYIILIAPALISSKQWSNVLAHILFIHNWFPSLHGAINGANWSVGAEMQFYVLMLILAPWARTARWWMLVLTMVGTSWIWRYGTTLLVPFNAELGAFVPCAVSTQLPGMLDEFLVGILLARLMKSEQGILLQTRMEKAKGKLLLILCAGITTWAVLMLFWKNAMFWNNPLMVTCFRTLLAVAFGLILLIACSLNSKYWLTFSTPFRYLGTISYGIYLWHETVLFSWKKIPWLTPGQALPLILICTIILSAMSWHFFEKPLMVRYGKK